MSRRVRGSGMGVPPSPVVWKAGSSGAQGGWAVPPSRLGMVGQRKPAQRPAKQQTQRRRYSDTGSRLGPPLPERSTRQLPEVVPSGAQLVTSSRQKNSAAGSTQ